MNIELFVSDDFSTDGTWEYLSNVVDQRVHILPRKENFNSPAGNFFRLLKDVDFSSFDYVGLSDQDDIWFKNKIKFSIDEIESLNADACSTDVIAFWSQSAETGRKKYIRKSNPIGKWNHLFESAGPGCTYLVKKPIATSFSAFLKTTKQCLSSVRNTHDWVLFAFTISENYKWVILNEPTMLYRQHSSNSLGANSGYKGIKRRVKMLFNGWYLNEVFLIGRLCKNESAAPFSKINHLTLKNLSSLLSDLKEMRRKKIDQFVLGAYFIFLHVCNLIKLNNFAKQNIKKE